MRNPVKIACSFAVALLVFALKTTNGWAAGGSEPSFVPIPVRDFDIRHGMPGWSVLPPKSGAWHLVGKGAGGVIFARNGDRPDDTYVASVTITRAETPVDNEERLRALSGASPENSDSKRYKMLATDFVSTESALSANCIRRNTRSEDHGAVRRSSAPYLFIVASDLICTHPEDSRLIASILFSRRDQPGSTGENVESLAKDFQNGFRFERLPKAEPEKTVAPESPRRVD